MVGNIMKQQALSRSQAITAIQAIDPTWTDATCEAGLYALGVDAIGKLTFSHGQPWLTFNRRVGAFILHGAIKGTDHVSE
jgi:hypothetical protein